MQKVKIGFGGGCHWCTEAVFQSLLGVEKVEQGYIVSKKPYDSPSEAVWLTYFPDKISTHDLVEIHLRTHSSSSLHTFREKYRSAVYYQAQTNENECKNEELKGIILNLAESLERNIITMVLPFVKFIPSAQKYKNYYQNNQSKPFCKTHIDPKLSLLGEKYSHYL